MVLFSCGWASVPGSFDERSALILSYQSRLNLTMFRDCGMNATNYMAEPFLCMLQWVAYRNFQRMDRVAVEPAWL